MRIHNFLLTAFLLLIAIPAFAQFPGMMADPPAYDICGKAMEIGPGEVIKGLDNAEASPSNMHESPAVMETTCIQTIENDVWFKFTAQEKHSAYEVIISANFCNTPAGLQALIIESENCSATSFHYRACSNKINTDTIKLFLMDPVPGKQYFIWVDGYDGTICEFDLRLRAKEKLLPKDYRFLRFDYDLADSPALELEGMNVSFTNNSSTIDWESSTSEDAAMFLVELLPDLTEVEDDSRYARVVGIVDAHNMVGEGRSNYSFIDYITPFQQGKTYNYRIVKVAGDGSRQISKTLSVKAKLVESFFLGDIREAKEVGSYLVRYINNKKGQNLDVSVEDAAGKQIKHMVLAKEPARDGEITIRMQEFEPGEYFFVMGNGKESFKRLFVHHGK